MAVVDISPSWSSVRVTTARVNGNRGMSQIKVGNSSARFHPGASAAATAAAAVADSSKSIAIENKNNCFSARQGS